MHGDYAGYLEHKQWKKEEFCVVENGACYDQEIERAFCAVPAKLRIVEIGFGNGNFLAWARARGHDIVGVEIIQELLDRANEAGFRTARSVDALLTNDASSFDLVAAFDVLEHIDPADLREFIRKVSCLLRPGGIFLARFPNGDSPFGLAYQNGDLTHRTALGVGRVSQIMRDTKFTCFKLYEPKAGAIGFVSLIKQLVKIPVRFGLERTLKHLYYGKDMPPALSMNYILIAKMNKIGDVTPAREQEEACRQ